VIRHAGPHAGSEEVRSEPAQRWPIGQEYREVIQPKAAGARSTGNAPLLLKDGELLSGGADAKPSDILLAVQHCHAKHVGVVLH
jgi:hypothetical protein